MEEKRGDVPPAPPEPAGAASAEPTYEVDVDNSPIGKAATVIASCSLSLLFAFGEIYLSR